MSTAIITPSKKAPGPAAPPAPPAPVAFHYTQDQSFVALLNQLAALLLISTYQANKLPVARATGNGLSMLVRTFERPMGMAADVQRVGASRFAPLNAWRSGLTCPGCHGRSIA